MWNSDTCAHSDRGEGSLWVDKLRRVCALLGSHPMSPCSKGSYWLKYCLICLKYGLARGGQSLCCTAALPSTPASSIYCHPPGMLAIGGGRGGGGAGGRGCPNPASSPSPKRIQWEKIMVSHTEFLLPLLSWLRGLVEGTCRAPSPTSVSRWEAIGCGNLPVRYQPQAREG